MDGRRVAGEIGERMAGRSLLTRAVRLARDGEAVREIVRELGGGGWADFWGMDGRRVGREIGERMAARRLLTRAVRLAGRLGSETGEAVGETEPVGGARGMDFVWESGGLQG